VVAKSGASDKSRGFGVLCRQTQTTFRQLPNDWLSPNLATTHKSLKIFRLRVIWPQKPQNWRGQTGTLLGSAFSLRNTPQKDTVHSKSQRVSCCYAYRVLRRLTWLRWSTVSELRGVKFTQFSYFCHFFPHKTPERYLFVCDLCNAMVTLQNAFFSYSMYSSGRSKVVPLPVTVSCDVWWEVWDSQICPNFLLWKMPVDIHNAYYTVRPRPIWTEDGSKRAIPCKDR